MKLVKKLGTFLLHVFFTSLVCIVCAVLLTASSYQPTSALEQVRSYSREIEFNYISWTLNALGSKFSSSAFSTQKFLSEDDESNFVRAYFKQVETVMILNSQVEMVYADPNVRDPLLASRTLREELAVAQDKLDWMAPLAESILQNQLAAVLTDLGFGVAGQIIPPPLYQVTDLPLALIVSPRDKIVRLADISLEPGMSTDDKEKLETEIFSELDHAALVVPVGGIGAYPSMVMQSTNLVWLTETIAHEWTHNYLTLRPLGINYNTSGELRTINETTASIAGKELGIALIAKYYPEFIPPPPVTPATANPVSQPDQPPIFDFRAAMKVTRDTVDTMLEEGRIDEAEAYMEMRRAVFWENGYLIRKINQAYFAFYGAYNDEPGGGAAGSDPIGPAVSALRATSPDLKTFLQKIAFVTSYEDLLKLSTGVEKAPES